LSVLVLFTPLQGGQINKSYAKRESVTLKAILGSCKVIKSKDDSIRIDVRYSFSDDEYKAAFSEFRDSLLLEEKFSEKSPIGASYWIIAVPEKMRLFLSSATGNISVEGVQSDIKAETGTGTVEVNKSTGAFNFETGIGNVQGTDIIIHGSSRFTSGTGLVDITLSGSLDYDMTVASGMGDAILNYNGNPLRGRFEMIAKHDLGRIVSPVQFEEEEIKRNDHFQYDRKSFKVDGRDTPHIRIETGNGQAKLIK
jgi:hypothetical protein